MRKAFQDIAQRLVRAEENFIDSLMEFGGITRAEATRVFDLYRREKIIKRDAVGGVYNVTHGAFLDRKVIRRALAASSDTPAGGKRRRALPGFTALHKRLAHETEWKVGRARRVVWLDDPAEQMSVDGMRTLPLAEQKAALVRGVDDGDLQVNTGRRPHGANWLRTLEFRDRDGNEVAYAELKVDPGHMGGVDPPGTSGGKRRHARAKPRKAKRVRRPVTARKPSRLAALVADINRLVR